MDGTPMEINMLVEKKYPLIKELLEKMLNLQLEAEEESTMAFELIKFIKSMLEETSSQALLQQIIASLHKEFAMTDLGPLNYFLGISVIRDSSGIFLSHKKYVVEILERAHMVNCNPSQTLVGTESKLGIVVCLHMHDPREPHFLTLKWILRYVRADSFCSSIEAEYRGVANVVAETCWLHNLLRELRTPLSSTTLVYCDNVRVLHVPSRYQFADIFTKGLSPALFEEFRSSLSVRCSPAPTAGEC
ncbi:ribonuclease H-like domain-containing protein [Tanacetum coccineum]|uniref:Ribonuclease H-like domain-containing protein n=1 Tax=Tanacetum coccineum TaxID=301880 RepID=A0ABQ4YY26_9ASTR